MQADFPITRLQPSSSQTDLAPPPSSAPSSAHRPGISNMVSTGRSPRGLRASRSTRRRASRSSRSRWRSLVRQSLACSSGCAPMATAGSSLTAWEPWPKPCRVGRGRDSGGPAAQRRRAGSGGRGRGRVAASSSSPVEPLRSSRESQGLARALYQPHPPGPGPPTRRKPSAGVAAGRGPRLPVACRCPRRMAIRPIR